MNQKAAQLIFDQVHSLLSLVRAVKCGPINVVYS